TPVQVASEVAVRRAQRDVGDVAQAQVLVVDHELADLVDGAELALRTQAEALPAVGDESRAHGEVALLEQFAQLGQIYVMRGDAVRVEQDADLARVDTVEVDLGDAVDSLD